MARIIETEDLNRVVLTRFDRFVRKDIEDLATSPVDNLLRLRIDQSAENTIVQNFLGPLSFQSRERIVRLLNKITEAEADGGRFLNLRHLWHRIASSHLNLKEVFYVRVDRFEHWRRHIHALDEDLPGISFLVDTQGDSIQSPAELFRALEYWPTFLRGDEPNLYRELQDGIACLHLHLSGSYPAPYYWVGIMNDRFPVSFVKDQKNIPDYLRGYRQQEDLDRIHRIAEAGKRIRWALFQFVKSVGLVADEKDISASAREALEKWQLDDKRRSETKRYFQQNQEAVDYAQQLVATAQHSTCPSLIGERWLLFLALRALRKLEKWSEISLLASHIWTYITAKNEFLSFAQQAEGVAGFDYFEHVFRLLKWNTSEQADKCAREIGQFLQESCSVVKVELMVAPPDAENASDYLSHIEKLALQIRETMTRRLSARLHSSVGKVSVGLIIHFIKDHGESLKERIADDSLALKIYHFTKRDSCLRELEAFSAYFSKGGAEQVVPLIAIDCANRELYCPPEVFSEVYEVARQKVRYYTSSERRLPIRCTHHVGEDFIFLMTGLRRIFEAMHFLKLQAGDRLGHASALGLNVEQWVRRSPTVDVHLIDQIDDAVFERFLLHNYKSSELEVRSRLVELERLIEDLSLKIFGAAVSPGVLERAWLRRGAVRVRKPASYSDPEAIPEWIRLQGMFLAKRKNASGGTHHIVPNPLSLGTLVDSSEALKLGIQNLSLVDYPESEVNRIVDEYNHDYHTVSRFLEIVPLDVSGSVPHLERVQEILRSLVIEQGLVIESNPTSNWLIGGVERHVDTPATQWLLNFPEMPVTLNPDDPTVFSTSIENEYFFAFSSLVHGSPDVLTRAEALRRVAAARRLALTASFLE